MRLDRIEIVEYDARWPGLFEEQRRRVESVMSEYLAGPVEHIGSTAVPGLPAKPIIDMAVVVRDHAECVGAFDALASIGWLRAPEPGDPEALKWSLCFPSVERRTHHLHVYEQGSDRLQTLLAFRDHLRVDAADRAEYGRIKRELAAVDDQDRPRYRTGKAPFIVDVLARLSS
ncbi:GrpB family protein [Kribbella sp. CA-293567]|uniref:GrpB family protein n=1 Tax=Kribbella sp. CA-293567 TaxID=3002436 RepID=UPI0022DD26C3|nr:GrpB family protein [Kribbella sp. CA-293567]WBQ07773.1 GrpB family protein [Kribbella sp. CA-293567]